MHKKGDIMNVLPINNQFSNPKFAGYQDLSKKILSSDRAGLIDIAEYFHTAGENELKEITGSNKSALEKLNEAIKMVITRKKCYIADGASFCKQRAEALDKKAAERNIFLQG